MFCKKSKYQNEARSMKDPKNVKRGRRARRRGADLQRQAVRMAKDAGLEAYNRDRGGAQHEQGDIEIEGHYYGCKRRTRIAQWLKPEKEEEGVVIREDRGKPYIVLDYEFFVNLLSIMKEMADERE
jgi:hypothetical protein|tara:strand:- start:967 stop:1344 length:378 start_codon:yes stop_codon:yes gene_type:complete